MIPKTERRTSNIEHPTSNGDPAAIRPRCLNPTRFLNRAAVREFLLETAAQTRAHRFTRVGEAMLVEINSRVMTKCLEIVRTMPSKGKTI